MNDLPGGVKPTTELLVEKKLIKSKDFISQEYIL